ncbi:hypothetical protein D8B26_001304 [Coccidioides posadasii str. Silveira]|uniref:Uncharacterized protein n=3 Tax=Coccidioides posadasii TaxID=199306 RepID=E9D9Z1_COCPS|nr:hypothetical protein CPC735_045920 [Coccidioides posadasii C735 delta SOWgp]EER23222.1 hypothetical protein CPC735_045920 [Coccidioides posadasii C735 delta SOWgp]EFW16722.1 conserved hypothetical protein [Coccidioides posadasii str. Silveira]KMM64516.1 hypothetical protein CPAG_00868 [Coccidioides posadasii RMSCC 3488]QVM06598.1 hypothetical protein D8B26_001304 [Coccidioides posadasii str. Silveira]|eukprot:XP_003065367.1 hypothetical protein CPC735_045920 [Coccidioides posadasii C735 delta SOWgp]
MGWFSSSSDAPQKASDGGKIAPDRSSRDKCYKGRDLFFKCLDQNGIIDAIKKDGEARAKCAKELQEFENACSATWVKYFKEKRVMEYRRDMSIERIKQDEAAGKKVGN